jgi:predicted urease superfamily metal-dependent hydrolase
LNLSIAIDFTASNGMPSHPSSLHYINHHKPNQYQIVIDAVSRILLNYDSDQRIPALGFGGKPHYPTLNSSVVNHCFALSGDMSQV